MTLHLRFAGLNLFARKGDGYDVYVTDASRATNGHDRKALHRHTAFLIVEEGSMTEAGRPDRRPFRRQWTYPGDLQDKVLDFEKLSGNDRFTLAPAPSQGSPKEPSWLPHLSKVDRRVAGDLDHPEPLHLAPLAATFHVDNGVFSGGGEIHGVTWLGDHKGDEPNSLCGWTQLSYQVDTDHVTLQRLGRDWVLHPPAPDKPIVAWVGNVAEADAHESIERHSGEVIDHFRWLYQHLPMRSQPISNLAHPKIPPHVDAKLMRPGSTFCPDGQYP